MLKKIISIPPQDTLKNTRFLNKLIRNHNLYTVSKKTTKRQSHFLDNLLKNSTENKTILAQIKLDAITIVQTSLANIKNDFTPQFSSIIQSSPCFILGDIHGELPALAQNLYAAGLIDKKGHWIGKNKKLIQTGDFIDRGNFSFETYCYLKKLQKEATHYNSEVILLLGNHELRRLFDNAFGGNKKFLQNATLFRTLLINDLIAGKIKAIYTLNNILFSHAGLHPEIKKQLANQLNISEEKLSNEQIVELLNSQIIIDMLKFKKAYYQLNEKEIQTIFHHPIYQCGKDRCGTVDIGGIFWIDGHNFHLNQSDPKIKQIVGHTTTVNLNIKKKGRVFNRDGILFNDTGLQDYSGGSQCFSALGNDQKIYEIRNIKNPYKLNKIRPINCKNWIANPVAIF